MEENLVNMAKSGNKDAFVDLVNIYQKKLYVIAYDRIYKEEDVKDAIQDTLLQAYTHLNTINNVGSFNGWITQILLNNCKDILKIREKTMFSYEDIEKEKRVLSDNDDYLAINSTVDVFSIMDLYPEIDKMMFMMHFSEGYTTNEISQMLNINENTIRSKICRLRKRLKEECLDEPNDIW